MYEKDWVNANAYMIGNGNIDNFGREIDCQSLIDHFGYQAGDKITFRVAAVNAVGMSEWSYPLPQDMQATAFSMLIL